MCTLAAVEASNERVAALNEAALTYASMYDEYDWNDDGVIEGEEYDAFIAGGGSPELSWHYGSGAEDDPWRNNPPDWLGVCLLYTSPSPRDRG